jgi:predicted Zn-dependent protease
VPAIVVQARVKASEGDFDGALRLLDDALARDPANERAGTLKGELLWRGKHDEAAALAALNKTVAASPGAVGAHVALIGIHHEAGRTAEAKTQFEALKKAAPNHPDTLFIEAQQALQAGDARSARDIASRLLRGMPDNPRVQMLAGAADFRLGAYNQAESNLARALRALPQHLPTRQLLAQTHLRTNQPAKALEVLAPAIEQQTADGPTLALAGEAHMMLGDTRRADQMFQGAFLQDYVNTADPADTSILQRILDQNKVTWTIFPSFDPRNQALAKLPGWKQTFTDAYATIYERQP